MRRRDSDGNVSELPELDLAALGGDEQLYLRVMLGLAETGNMFHGRFVEVHVGRVLGADVPNIGTNAWDLYIPDSEPITVEVKACPRGGKYRLTSEGADVWVFVTFTDKSTRPRDFSYVVASSSAVRNLRKNGKNLSQKSMTQKRVFAEFGPVLAEPDLLTAVRRTARESNH